MKNELSLPQRAAVALGTAEHEAKLIALAKESTDIIAVIDQAGRDQAHRIGMTLRAARTNITKTGKAARDDATAFGKAVIAEEKRLIGIIEPEEERVMVLRDAFDAKVQAEKDAKIAAERARIESIQNRIEQLRNFGWESTSAASSAITQVIAELKSRRPSESDEAMYEEFQSTAEMAWGSRIEYLIGLRDHTATTEAEAARQQAEREAAAAQAQKDREELAAAQAELKRQQAEQAAEMQKQRDALAAEMKAEREKAEAIRKLEDDQRKFVQQQERDKLEAANAEMRMNMAKLADQERELNARRDAENAERLAADRQLEQETAAVDESQRQHDAAEAVITEVKPDPSYVGCNVDLRADTLADLKKSVSDVR